MKCAVCKVRFGSNSRIIVVENRICCYIHTQAPAEPDIEAIKSLLGEHRAEMS